jgi:hypothetical protein
VQAGRSRIRNTVRSIFQALGPGVYLTSNRNEYQKEENNVFGE